MFELLKVLIVNAGLVMLTTVLKSKIWEDIDKSDDVLTVYIRRLREKIEPDPAHPKYIETVKGFGYRFTGKPVHMSRRFLDQSSDWKKEVDAQPVVRLLLDPIRNPGTHPGLQRGRCHFHGCAQTLATQTEALELELADCQAAHFQKLYGYFQRIVAHEYGKGLIYILNKSSETLEGLGKEQTAFRDKQDGIIAKSNELQQHSMNIPYVFAFEPDKLEKELLNIRQLIESVLLELFPYAESQGVTLRPNLADIEPIFLNREVTKLAIRNLVHNSINYSEPGRWWTLTLLSEKSSAVGKRSRNYRKR